MNGRTVLTSTKRHFRFNLHSGYAESATITNLNLIVMESNFYHFAKVIDGEIYNTIDEKRYTLRGLLSGGFLQYQNGTPDLHTGHFLDFRICVDNETQIELLDIPYQMAAIVILKNAEKKESSIISPSVFLSRIMNIVYELVPGGTTHDFMYKNRKKRNRELVEARQVIMACYYEAFDKHKKYPISLAMVGSVFAKDHATVLHAIKTVNNLKDTESSYVEKYSNAWKLVESVRNQNRLLR